MDWIRVGRGRLARPLVSLVVGLADHGLEYFRVAVDGNDNGALLDAIRSTGDDRQDLPLIGHGLADGERTVGAQLDRLATECNLRVGLGAAVENHLGIDVKLQLSMPIEDALSPAAELRRSYVAHWAAQTLFE